MTKHGRKGLDLALPGPESACDDQTFRSFYKVL